MQYITINKVLYTGALNSFKWEWLSIATATLVNLHTIFYSIYGGEILIIELNRKNKYNIPEEQLNSLAMSFYYAMLEYFQSEKGQAEFAEFLEMQNEKQAA